jgi:hypothetical protein
MNSAERQSYITTDGQSARLSSNKASIWGLRPDLYYCHTVAGLFVKGALSDERKGLSFTFAAGPRQLSHFRVRVPWDYSGSIRPRLQTGERVLSFITSGEPNRDHHLEQLVVILLLFVSTKQRRSHCWMRNIDNVFMKRCSAMTVSACTGNVC